MRRVAAIVTCSVLAGVLVSPLAARQDDAAAPATDAAKKPVIGMQVGEAAPDAQVAKANGDPVQLSDLYLKGPIVLVFYRGGWCPYCNTALVDIQKNLKHIGAAGGTVIALTPERADFATQTRTEKELQYAVLSDFAGEAAEAFKLRFTLPEDLQVKYKEYGVDLSQKNWDGTWMLPHPAMYVIDKSGIIRYASVNEDYKVRADPMEAVEVLKQIRLETNRDQGSGTGDQ